MRGRVATWTVLALACATSPTRPAVMPAVDVSGIPVQTASPRPGTPSYDQLAASLGALSREHARGTLTIGDKEIAARSEIATTTAGCVLLHTLTFEAHATGRHVTLGQLLSLPQIAASSVTVSSQTGRSACVNFEGRAGAVIQIDVEPVRERTRGQVGLICFDTRDTADAAALALTRMVELCAAGDEGAGR